jgi:hypothetical protein
VCAVLLLYASLSLVISFRHFSVWALKPSHTLATTLTTTLTNNYNNTYPCPCPPPHPHLTPPLRRRSVGVEGRGDACRSLEPQVRCRCDGGYLGCTLATLRPCMRPPPLGRGVGNMAHTTYYYQVVINKSDTLFCSTSPRLSFRTGRIPNTCYIQQRSFVFLLLLTHYKQIVQCRDKYTHTHTRTPPPTHSIHSHLHFTRTPPPPCTTHHYSS